MTPKSFDDKTCAELAGDSRVRTLEARGRALAEAGSPRPERKPIAGSYWSQVQDEADYRVELHAYERRVARLQRLAGDAPCK